MKKKLAFAAVAVLSMASAPQAFARCSPGEIANFFCEVGLISKEAANVADYTHAELDRPIETQILPGVADVLFPGSGDALRDWDHMNRNGGFDNFSGLFNLQQPQMQQVPSGNFCATQAGRFGPMANTPIGTPCYVTTSSGLQSGQVSF